MRTSSINMAARGAEDRLYLLAEELRAFPLVRHGELGGVDQANRSWNLPGRSWDL